MGALIKFSDITNEKFIDITMRIIAGFGIDISNEYCAIDFETYCRINCFIKYQTTDPVDLIRIWIKILNPQSIMVISV